MKKIILTIITGELILLAGCFAIIHGGELFFNGNREGEATIMMGVCMAIVGTLLLSITIKKMFD